MNCPKCGLQTIAEQKFCRSCGERLELTTKPLVTAVSNPTNLPLISRRDEPLRPNAMAPLGFLLMFIGVAVGVVGKKLMHEDLVTVFGIMLSLAGMFLTAYPYLVPASRKRHGSSLASEPSELAASAPKSLPPDRAVDYIPSVTERTTDLLQNAGATRQRQDGEESQP